VFTETVDVILPSVLDEPAELPAFQFHATILFPFPFILSSEPTVKPSEPNAV